MDIDYFNNLKSELGIELYRYLNSIDSSESSDQASIVEESIIYYEKEVIEYDASNDEDITYVIKGLFYVDALSLNAEENTITITGTAKQSKSYL